MTLPAARQRPEHKARTGTASSPARHERRGAAATLAARLRRPTVTDLLALVAVLCVAVAGIEFSPAAGQAATVVPGLPVPAAQLPAIQAAARSCPALTGPRLAAQVMAASAFNPQATTGGGSGVAGLTDAVWKQWAPSPTAVRTNATDAITALAHDMCDLAGRLTAAAVPGDLWQLSLAAFRTGLPSVAAVRAVPATDADYVNTVTGYANWYAEQSVFGGTGPSPSPSPTPATAGPQPVPAADLAAIIAAGRHCSAMTPALIAAQLMAGSSFNPNALSSAGAQGIAQFRPDIWARYAPSATASPWDPATAIGALGAAMCDLTAQMSGLGADPYKVALAAFQWGTGAIAGTGATAAVDSLGTYIATVEADAAYYAKDPRLAPAAPSAPATPASPSPSPAPTTTGTSNSPTTPVDPAGWQLTFADEFTGAAGTAPNPATWTHDTGGGGWGNSERDYDTDSTTNAALDGAGHLDLTATTAGAAGKSCWYGACTYTSARLTTLGHFSQAYGRISARIKLPAGSGLWPAFWALGDNLATAGWPEAGELDVMTSSHPGTISAGLHGPNDVHYATHTAAYDTFAAGYHTFTADWYPDHVSFAVDGVIFSTQYRPASGWVFDHPFYLVLDLGVGGTQAGTPPATTIFPAHMLIDWIHVYQPAPPATAATGVISGIGGKCVAATATVAELDSCNPGTAQTWTLDTDGTLHTTAGCLSAAGTGDGAHATVTPCAGTPAQKWQAETNGALANPASGRCLDDTGHITTAHNPLQLWTCTGGSNQTWTGP